MKHTPESAQRAIELLDEIGTLPPDPGDELPEGYVYIVERKRSKTTLNEELTQRIASQDRGEFVDPAAVQQKLQAKSE